MLRLPGRLRAIGEAIDSDPDLRPTIAARSFPPRRSLKGTFADYAAALEARVDPAETEGCFFERDITPHGYGDLLLVDNGRLRANRTHEANGLFQDVDWYRADERLRRASDYLIRIADSMHQFYDVLGGDTFMWEGQTQREPGEVVPSWDDHHRAAGVDISTLAGAEPPSMKGRFLPRIVVPKQEAPPEEPDA